MKRFSRRAAASTLRTFPATICEPRRSSEPQREPRHPILSRLWLHWRPAVRLLSRTIAAFQPCPVSAFCNCLLTSADPACALILESNSRALKLQRLKPGLKVPDADELKLVPPERPRLQDRKITRLPVVSKSWNRTRTLPVRTLIDTCGER